MGDGGSCFVYHLDDGRGLLALSARAASPAPERQGAFAFDVDVARVSILGVLDLVTDAVDELKRFGNRVPNMLTGAREQVDGKGLSI